MRTARRLIRRAIDLVALAVGHASLSVVLWRTGGNPVTVLDIDNTLADSWPTLVTRITSERERLRGLAPLPGMRSVAHDPAIARGDAVIYLSHRSLWFGPLTNRWLREAGFDASPLRVILVPSAAARLRSCDGSPMDPDRSTTGMTCPTEPNAAPPCCTPTSSTWCGRCRSITTESMTSGRRPRRWVRPSGTGRVTPCPS